MNDDIRTLIKHLTVCLFADNSVTLVFLHVSDKYGGGNNSKLKDYLLRIENQALYQVFIVRSHCPTS